MAAQLSFSNDVFSTFAFYATVLIMKLTLMAGLTSMKRIAKGVFANPEDCKAFGNRETKPIMVDDGVERVRRNHLNDLENIPSFIFLGFLYVLTGPTLGSALLRFRIFTVSRFLHMIAYQLPLPQPSRALCFIVGLGVNISMAIEILGVANY